MNESESRPKVSIYLRGTQPFFLKLKGRKEKREGLEEGVGQAMQNI